MIIENPEVHLHPRAQSDLIKILCELSKTGVQVIIETHSDHIINGVRVFAKDNIFLKEIILFIPLQRTQEKEV